ncbi:adventurous gliding motility protein AgmK [Plesiocystis pacifica SIR-1]|uniref:Adventurous gliding motility protein AgmK n=1 Tax=Plesiocystis pacifica SIR-1 TaxID=391625 RepID=A6G5X8_9BACT|nr:tetratricopeptide repeat protein [Plesiocystis pacifica]EDM78752.1 adventurous gliding motility protein AgmK [Plesiocystis pacifica SIR-1]
MADVRSALLSHLRSPDDSTHQELTAASAAAGRDLAAASAAVREDTSDVEAAAQVLALLVLEQHGKDGADSTAIVDRAKNLAQRAPRKAEGNEVALVCGEVLWRVGGQPRLAEPYFRRVRRHDASNVAVVSFYRELFSGPNDGSQLMQVLVQARRASKDADRRFELAEEMATLARERLGSTDRAIEVWRSVVREDGQDARALANLEKLYREGKKWTALVELLKDAFERIEDTADNKQLRIDKLLEITALYRKELRLDAMALATLQRILDIDPRHQGSLEVLADTYASSQRWNDLLGVQKRLRDAAKEDGDAEAEAEVLRKVAAIWVEKLGNPQRALDPLRELLGLIPGDRKARDMMAQIHEQRRDWRALIALRREELQEREGDEALELRLELARLAEEKLGDRREAIAGWNAVLENHGEVDKALAALARLYERESRWAEAAEIRHRQVAKADSVGRAVKLLTEIGHIYSERLRDQPNAIRVWREIARLVPGHDKALRTLRDAYSSSGMWDELTELYVEQGRVSDLVDALQSAADRVSATEDRVDLYRRVAQLCREKLGQPERAVKALERTLAIQPNNLIVARELLPIYREQSNWAALMRTINVLLEASESVDDKLELIEQLREIAVDKLQSPQLTFQWAARAYVLRPTDEALRGRLEAAAANSDNWDQLTRLFEDRIAGQKPASAEATDGESIAAAAVAPADEAEQLLLLEKLAIIARDQLSKPDDAQRYFRRIMELDQHNEAAMEALEAIYTSTRRWDDLSEVYRWRLNVAPDDAARLITLRGLARLQEDHLKDLDAAVQTYDKILELEPEDRRTLDSLAEILRGRGEWQRLAAILETKLLIPRNEDGSGRALEPSDIPVLFELSSVRSGRLSDTEGAIRGFLRILDLEPMHRDSVAALEEIYRADPSTSVTIMRGLLPYYQRIGDKQREAEAMEVLLAAAETTGEGEGEGEGLDAEAKEQLREQKSQLAAIYEQMPERRSDALKIYAELFEGDAADWEGRQLLQRLGRSLEQMELVANAYARVLDAIKQHAAEAEAEGRALERAEANLRRDLLLELGAIWRDDLQRPLEAEKAYAEILERDETHQAAYEALEALLRGREAPAELVELYRRRVDVVFNQREQRELLGRIIEIARTVLGDRETAVETAEELLDLIPDDLPTIELLAQMYAEGGEPEDLDKLEELLGRWAELAKDRELRHELNCKRASLRVQHQGDAFGAVDLLGSVIGENADHEQARGLLEQLLDVSEVQMQVAGLLEPIYQRRGDHEGRIRVLHVRRNNAAAEMRQDDATGYLLAIAKIQEHDQRDIEQAFASLRAAYLEDPRRLDSRDEVERLGLSTGRERDLIAIWTAALASEQVDDKTLRIDLTHRKAMLFDERLRDSEGARGAWLALLDLDPPDAALAHKTVEALVRLHLEAGDFAALVDAQRALLRFVEPHHQQVKIRLEIATIQLEQLMDRVGAALTWAEVVDMEPANRVALDALEALLTEEAEWQRLTEVLEHRISVADEPRQKSALWRRIGDIRREQLQAHQRAIEAYQSILDLKTGHDDSVYAQTRLVELNRELERWPDVEEGLRRLIAFSGSDAERVRLLAETAEVVGKKLERPDDALDLLKRVLDAAPTDARARSMVSSYLEPDETRERAIRILTPLYEAEQNWAALLELQELQARKQPSGRRRLQALLRVARTQEEKLEDPGRAFAVLCEAMAEAGDQPELSEILDKVERLGAVTERSEALYDAYSRTVDHILDSALQQRVLRAMGEVALNRLGRLDDARKVYERLLESAPEDAGATDALEQIYVRQGDDEALAALLVRKVDGTSETAARDELLIRAAEIHRTRLDDAEEAIRLYERLSTDALDRESVQEVLEPLYESTGRFRELANHLTRKLGQLRGKAAVDTHLRLGRLYGEHLEDPEEGIRHLGAALKSDPDHAVGTDELSRYLQDPNMRSRAAEMLEPVFLAVQDWERLLLIQEVRLSEAEDHSDRVQIMLRMARMQEEQLEDLDKAFDAYSRVFKEDPENTRVRDHLGRLANVLATTDKYAELLTEYVEQNPDDNSESTLAIVHESAKLWAGTLRQPAKSVPLYQRLLEANPDDRSVFAELESALSMGEMWRELADAYWREAEDSLDETRQVELLMKLSRVALDVLDESEIGAKAFQRILEVQPENERARAQLEQVYQQTEKWQELLDLLRDRLGRSLDQDDRTPVYLQIADLQDEALDDWEGALDTLESLLGEVPNEPNAVATLERIADHRVPARHRVFSILEPIYDATGNTPRLVAVCEWRLTVTEDPGSRHELHRELARHLESIPEGAPYAFRALARALYEPGPEDALLALDSDIGRLAKSLETPGALADALVAAADGEQLANDADRRIELLVRAARIRSEDSPEIAVEILRKALELRDDEEEALALMDRALVRLGYHEELREVLTRRVEVEADDVERVDLLRRLATLHEDILANPEEAEQAWRRLLDIEPSDTEALQRLSRTYAASGSTTELIEVLERRIDASTDEDERRSLRMQLASIHRESAKNREAEIDVLRALLAEAPSDDDAMAALARALLAEERHAEAADVVQDRATIAPTAERKASLMLDAARMYAGPLEDLIGAVERYEQVLQLLPGQEGAVADLVGLCKQEEVSEQAAGLVRPHLEDHGRWADLAIVLDARTTLSEDPDEVLELLKELATVRHEKLGDAAGALAATMKIIDSAAAEELEDPLNGAMRLAGELDGLEALIDELAKRAADSDRDPEIRVAIGMAAAHAASDFLGDPDKALAVLTPLLDAELADLPACVRIEELALRKSDPALVERALQEGSRLAAGMEEHLPMLVRLGEARIAIEAWEGAVEAFRDALDIDVGLEGAVRGLETVLRARLGADGVDGETVRIPDGLLDALDNAYMAASNNVGLAQVARVRLREAEGSDRVNLLQNLGTLIDNGGGSPKEALEAWGALLALDAESSEALERVLALAETELAGRAGELLSQAVEASAEAGRSSPALCLATARAWLSGLNQPDKAKAALVPLLEEQPEHVEGLGLLVETARALGDAKALHGALRRSAAAQGDPVESAGLWREAASVAEQMLAEPALAIEDLRQLIDADETDGPGWSRLLALLAQSGDHEALVDALGRRVMITEDEAERRELRYRQANHLVDKLERFEDAITVYNDMLASDPNELVAVNELQVLLRRLERWQDIRDLLERKLEIVEGEEQIAVQEEMARLAEEKLDDTTDAVEVLQRVVMEHPERDATRVWLERLLTKEERWHDLSELLEGRMDRLRDAGDTDGYRELASQLASLLAEKLDDSDRAQSILESLLEVDPSYVPALLSLASVHEARGDEESMRTTLERAAALEPQGPTGARLQLRLAMLTEEAEPRRAHLEKALSLDPANVEAGKQLLELSRSEERWDQVAYLLEMAVSREKSDDKRRELQLERVDILVAKVQDIDGALRVLASIYEQVQDDVEVNRRIADALFTAQRYEEAVGMYHWLVEITAGKRSKIRGHYLARLGRIEIEAGQGEEALKHLEEAYRLDTTNVETLLTLGNLHERNERWTDALKIYRSMLLQNADKSGLLRRGDIYLSLSRVHMGLGEKPKAQAMLRRGVEEDSTHKGLKEALEAIGG